MSYHVVTTLMMKNWTSAGKSQRPTSWPLANIKFVSQGRSGVSVANLRRNSTLKQQFAIFLLLVVLIYFDDHGGCIGWCGVPCPTQHDQGFPRCHWTSLLDERLQRNARAAAMVINVACGPVTYKTQLLAYLLCRKPIVVFCNEMKKCDSDDINEECSIFNVKTLWC